MLGVGTLIHAWKQVAECLQFGLDALITKPATQDKIAGFLQRYIFPPKQEAGQESPQLTGKPELYITRGRAGTETPQITEDLTPGGVYTGVLPTGGESWLLENEEQPINLAAAIEMAHGDADFVTELLQAFLPDCAEKLKLMLAAAIEDNAEEVKAHAHTIKGAASVVGAESLTVHCLSVEKMLREGKSLTCVARTIDQMFTTVRASSKFLATKGIHIEAASFHTITLL